MRLRLRLLGLRLREPRLKKLRLRLKKLSLSLAWLCLRRPRLMVLRLQLHVLLEDTLFSSTSLLGEDSASLCFSKISGDVRSTHWACQAPKLVATIRTNTVVTPK